MKWWGWGWWRDDGAGNGRRDGAADREVAAARRRLDADRRRRGEVQRAADRLAAAIEQGLRGTR